MCLDLDVAVVAAMCQVVGEQKANFYGALIEVGWKEKACGR